MTDLHEIQNTLDDIVQDLAQALPEIDKWGGWVAYLLEALEVEAMDLDPDHPAQFEALLSDLAGAIADRLKMGRW